VLKNLDLTLILRAGVGPPIPASGQNVYFIDRSSPR
jgi:hypothetical protein